MNRVKELFATKKEGILNVYFTAGYPQLDDTVSILQSLSSAGVDLIELGIPYSDPLADGETIQQSGSQALSNGMTLALLFEQVKEARKSVQTPIVLMGYYNQMLQYGVDRFLDDCVSAGVDGLILPDLPMDVYQEDHEEQFRSRDLTMTFLITPETSEARIRQADQLSTGFLYMVSKSSITGSASDISSSQQQYFQRINAMNLSAPRLIGFGIHDRSTYEAACAHSQGAIIGSAFIRALAAADDISVTVPNFIARIRD